MSRLPTVKIATKNGPVVINKSDFDETKHTLFTDDKGGSGDANDKGAPKTDENGLRTDGPTIAEFVAAGYSPTNYPPDGYASRSTAEEIDEAIKAATPAAPAAPAGEPEQQQTPTTDPATQPQPENERMLVTKKGRKFIVVNEKGEAIEREGIDKDGYTTEADAWGAVTAIMTANG